MSKKVVFNGIEILTSEGDSSAQNMLGFVETIINDLESGLNQTDENFHLSIKLDFSPKHLIKHSFSVTSLTNNGTRAKVMRILKKSTSSFDAKVSGMVRFDIQVGDG
jgi:hypothetical protein